MRPRFAVQSTGVCRIDVERRVADHMGPPRWARPARAWRTGPASHLAWPRVVAAASGEARSTARPAPAWSSRLRLAGADCGEVGGHPHLVGDDHAAGLECLLPAETELATANRPAHLDADTAASLRIGGDAMHRRLEPDWTRLAMHRQVASDPVVALVDVLDRGRLEADRRVVLDVEEVGRAKMVVPARLVRCRSKPL